MLKFILVKDKIGYEISDIVEKVTWSGRKNSPARSVQLQLLDDPDIGEENRPGIDVYEGHHLIFLEDDNELFSGIIMSQSRSQDRKLTVTAYDSAIYLSNNKDCFSYTKKTLTEIFLDICKRYELTRGEVAAVTYKIPSVAKVNTTIYDILCMAMSSTYKATGERYYILVKNGQLHLLRRKEQVTKLVLETGQEGSEYGNLTQYTYTKDIANTKTRLKLISKEGKTVTQWRDGNLEERIGRMQEVQKPGDEIPAAKLKEQAITQLNELKKPVESLNVTAMGISSIYSGMAVYISIPEIGIGRTFYVDSDSHTWEGDYHSMKLTLNFATDLESLGDNGAKETDKKADKAASEQAKQAIKDAAAALKLKKAEEKIIINCGKKAEKDADRAESGLKKLLKLIAAFPKQKTEKAIQNQAKKIGEQYSLVNYYAGDAKDQYKTAQEAFTNAKALLNASQSSITSKAKFAVQQAESNARRAKTAEVEAYKAAEKFLPKILQGRTNGLV